MTELTKKTTGFLAEFRQFIARGNVLDMAVGVIIGGAFGKISTSLEMCIRDRCVSSPAVRHHLLALHRRSFVDFCPAER